MSTSRYHYLRAAIAVAAAGGLVVVWRRPFRAVVTGGSMEPGLEAGDVLVAVRHRPRRIRRGDVVVVEHPSRGGLEVVKRVVGVPGDRVEGRVLGPDRYWLAGDRPEASTDSRSFGPVGAERVRGVVVFRSWPPGRMGRVR